ncbi:MAG: hypothetical protein AMDU5_GPLC00004G0299 [Thermoplasmatales archaeon Gpl]|jgi:alkylhydroperoxidase/carboxymuconolactone decarboxylase family protein YurZ|nr:MAG: hypothetical protein AMDU5_GPLC00004G0299 [Thermoplasmatales archaeon Gpl]
MTDEMEEIERFAKSTLGGMPEVIKLLGHHNVELAKEQFRENNEMYLGRKYVQKKTLALMAMSVSLSNGQESSAMIHFKLAQNFGAKMLEILDSIKVAKMVVMASTMSVMTAILPVVQKRNVKASDDVEIKKILAKIQSESHMESLPEDLVSLSSISFGLLDEHLKEKSELLSPFIMSQKDVFLIAFADAVSIRYPECAKVYLSQFFIKGGTEKEMEDALFLTRFITGNRTLTSATGILKW